MDVRTILSRKLKEFREREGLKLDEVGARIGKSGKTVSAWEKGRGQPDADMLIHLCDIYRVKNVSEFYDQDFCESPLTKGGQRIGRAYDRADDSRKRTVEVALEPYMNGVEIKEAPRSYKQDTDIISVYTASMSVAAGLGNYLEERVEFEDKLYPYNAVPIGTDFAVKVVGDSMEPKYFDGDIVFVKERVEINDGDVGIFALNGNSYIKELSFDRSKHNVRLISNNKRYDDIIVRGDDRLKTIGCVIGRWSEND